VAEPDTLYVTSVRSGEVPGIHAVGIEGAHDRIELRHEARGREGFAHGAVRAAEWIRGRRGLFTFEQVMDDLLTERRTGEEHE
jgi:4-hydroxy-tetrahydrodipicolinate reductase